MRRRRRGGRPGPSTIPFPAPHPGRSHPPSERLPTTARPGLVATALAILTLAASISAPAHAQAPPFVTAWHPPGFSDPYAVAADNAGFVYVADIISSRILKYTDSGGLVTQWGSAGSGNGQFNVAAAPGGQIDVADTGNGCIHAYGPGGSTPAHPTTWGRLKTI